MPVRACSQKPPLGMDDCCLVIDIGKTNVKLHLLNKRNKALTSTSRKNTTEKEGLYPHADVKVIWQWMQEEILKLSGRYVITRISITTHGATAALVDANADPEDDGLVLPILDYEFSGLENAAQEYSELRPNFFETFSPELPVGLNLGRQLFWQQKNYAAEFSRATNILMYPQYWAWRLSGVLSTEVTSLGCHTDLWQPEKNEYSALVKHCSWNTLFPAIASAWESLGPIRPELSERLGLPATCQVYTGVHDSNASFSRYKIRCANNAFTVISTGTWTVLMASGVSLDLLDPSRDMLANVDVSSQPVACARFMGGREFEGICAELGGEFGGHVNQEVIQKIINNQFFALPDFSQGSGPFGGCPSEFVNKSPDVLATEGVGVAVASIYCALMMDYQLDQLQSKGDIFIEGAFLQNPLMCAMLAKLRQQQNVYLSADSTGTVQGCARLTRWHGPPSDFDLSLAPKIELQGLQEYRQAWRFLAEAKRACVY